MEALQAPLPTGSDQSPYQSIDSDGGEIRLVELSPGHYDDDITLSLRTVKLEERVTEEEMLDEGSSDGQKSGKQLSCQQKLSCQFEYEALSYAWGTAISSRKVLVDGTTLPITESLDQGLRRLRFIDCSRILWIDALCINQRDTKERSHQVQHMATIYKCAKHVLVWLGEWPNYPNCPNLDDCQSLWLSTLQQDGREIPTEVSRHICQHLVDVIALPWFSRLWVIQEMALARADPMVLIGSLSVGWSDLVDTVYSISVHDGRILVDVDLRLQIEIGGARLYALEKIRSGSNSHRGLYWCLVMSEGTIATDMRDKVYGLLGLCDFQVMEPITVDYSQRLEHILAEATLISVLEESAYPYLDSELLHIGVFEGDDLSSSWVINFPTMRSMNYEGVFNSELDAEDRKRRRGSVHLSADYRTLYVHGRYIGIISDILDRSSNASDSDPMNLDFNQRITDAEIYDFYRHKLEPLGISSVTLLHVLRQKTASQEESDHFADLLLGSRHLFRLPFSGDEIEGRYMFVTEEGYLGIVWHPYYHPIPEGTVLVCLFGTEVPFILSPVPGTQSYEMINVAYVPGCGDEILENPYEHSKRKAWIDFAAEGGREYAIV